MKLLIVTQKVAKNDPILGFFHCWLEEFSKNFEKITVICLEKGEYNLPENVEIFSLGKEKGNSKIKELFTFYYLLFTLRKQYDTVFVHMNQEYVILAGDLWRLMGKRVYLWRNHHYGDLWTRFAVWLSHKVFYTSPSSYTARFKKAVRMPAGIDTDFFRPDPRAERIPNSVLFLGRISPVKKVLEFIDWAKTEGFRKVTIAGPILPADREYGELVKLKIENSKLKINYVGPVDQEGARRLYQSHETYVNLTPAGSFDKTILEAAACGASLMVRSPDFSTDFKVEDHSLNNLSKKLFEEMK